ncbi:hypothetical protein CPB84DRAFT_1844485 [Gymnopilus junonius]|uniref:C2H2-type domain-containing protein n=1 Tax=Gymnopilus junonius TaxID=109634 RepID=A0A9P5TQ87_GYMJU|nr:hypothetical protein CPB84DRAFT_1844485 [Gymnopilus junonius]
MLSQPPDHLAIPGHFLIHSDNPPKLPSSFYTSPPLDSPPSSSPSQNYSYAPRSPTAPFDPSAAIFDHHQSQTAHSFSSPSDQQQSYDINSSAASNSAPMNSYQLPESPSPVDPQPSVSSALPQPIIAPQSQERFLHSDVNPYPAEDRSLPQTDSGSDHPSHRQQAKYLSATLHNSLLDQRRMSEPAALTGTALYAAPMNDHYNQFAFSPPPLTSSRPAPSLYVAPLHRGASMGSLRDIRHHHFDYPHQQSDWKEGDSRHRESHEYYHGQPDVLDEPVSPMHQTFVHGLISSPTSGLPYSPISENLYGPSPPGTGTSTSSSVAPLSAGLPCSPTQSMSQHLQRSLSTSQLANDAIDRKTYSFVALPGNTVKKRPRRRYDEIERLYVCSWPDCNKSYGTLNHLNAHVTMQKHGLKRSPNEFKELRKQWRKQKKEQEAAVVSMRHDSYSDSYDDHTGFNQRYLAHSLQQRPHSSHHPGLGSVTIGTTNRYSIPIDDIRYPVQERDDGMGAYDRMISRHKFGNMQPASWHGGSHLPVQNIQQQPFATSLSAQHAHYSQLPQLAINPRLPPSADPDNAAHLSRLPQNSTLLTPLPGYSTLSLIQNNSGSGAYTSQGYETYEDDNGRPGTGHASIASMGHGSGDDFDHSQ